MADFLTGDWLSGDWSGAGGGTVTTSNLLLLGVGCVAWATVILPTWYEV